MMEEKETQTQETEVKEEKKENKFSSFFKKVSQKFDDATYDMRLQSNFDKTHKKYTVYTGISSLQSSPEIAVEEHLDEGYVLTLDEEESIVAGTLIKNNENGEVRHVVDVSKSTLTVEFEGKSNIKPATKIVIGDLAQKVEVIKVDKDYYIK